MKKLYVYMFVSRNKDNKDIVGFKRRCRMHLRYYEDEEEVFKMFKRFIEEGIYGETSRMYRSVNARDEEKVREALIVKLLLEKPSMTKINSIAASVANQVENRAESKWLFDFDCNDNEILGSFLDDVMEEVGSEKTHFRKTQNGFAIVVDHGFDTRKLMEKYKDIDVSLKKDDMLFIASGRSSGMLNW